MLYDTIQALVANVAPHKKKTNFNINLIPVTTSNTPKSRKINLSSKMSIACYSETAMDIPKCICITWQSKNT